MTWLRDVLTAHQLTLSLLDGQAFFALGFSVIFLARRSARIEIARNLLFLAVFGFCEALVAWSPLWIGSSDVPSPALSWLRLLLLGAGYAFLLTFALQIFMSLERHDRECWTIAGGLAALWLIGLIVLTFDLFSFLWYTFGSLCHRPPSILDALHITQGAPLANSRNRQPNRSEARLCFCRPSLPRWCFIHHCIQCGGCSASGLVFHVTHLSPPPDVTHGTIGT